MPSLGPRCRIAKISAGRHVTGLQDRCREPDPTQRSSLLFFPCQSLPWSSKAARSRVWIGVVDLTPAQTLNQLCFPKVSYLETAVFQEVTGRNRKPGNLIPICFDILTL